MNVCIIALVLFACAFPNVAHAASYSSALQGGALGVSASSTKGSLVVKQYTINSVLDTDSDTLDAAVTIYVKNGTNKTISTLYFRNMAYSVIKRAAAEYGDSAGGETSIEAVRVQPKGKHLKYSVKKKDRSIIQVKLGKYKLKPGKAARIRIEVATSIPGNQERLGLTETDHGKMYVLNWCWPYLADYRNGKWSLNPFPKNGENRFSRATTYDFTLKAPRSFKVATSGVDKTSKGITKCKTKGLRDFAVVACNFMKKRASNVRGVRVNTWYLPGAYARQYREDVFPAALDAVSYLTSYVGKLPFKEIDVVQVFAGIGANALGSMEYPGLIAMGGDRYYYSEYPAPAKGYLTRTTYHEMCHQWFFAAVGNDEYNEPWLDEGIASYYDKWAMWTQSSSTTRYLAQIAGKPVAQYLADQRNAFRKSVSSVEKTSGETKLNQSVVGFKSYFGTAYGTSVWFLLQLEDAIGHQNFKALMKDYYATYRLREATTAGFLRIARAHCPDSAKSEVNALIKKYF